MEVIVVKNYEEASDAAFKVMVEVVKNNPSAVLGLATGSTPIGLYKRMIKDHKENGTSYANVKSFNLDEYYGLPRTHEQSYYRFMCENLFDFIDINKENVEVPQGNTDIQAECDRYNALLRSNVQDIQLLGIGGNGHIGFNEPGTDFDSLTHYVELDQRTREDNARLFFNNNIDEVPTHAVTMGIANIMNAKKVLVIACGKGKAEAVKKMVDLEPSTDCPASALQNHPNTILVIDEDAASLLNK